MYTDGYVHGWHWPDEEASIYLGNLENFDETVIIIPISYAKQFDAATLGERAQSMVDDLPLFFAIQKAEDFSNVMKQWPSPSWIQIHHWDLSLLRAFAHRNPFIASILNEWSLYPSKYQQHVEEEQQAHQSQAENDKQDVYIAQAGRYYKIGISRNPGKRIKSFKGPNKTELLFVIKTDDAVVLERELQDRFSEKNHRGEWFALDEIDLAYLQRLAVENGN